MKMVETKWKKETKTTNEKWQKIEMIFILIMTKTMRISQKNWSIFRRLHHFQWKLSMIGTIICQTEGIKCNKKKQEKTVQNKRQQSVGLYIQLIIAATRQQLKTYWLA